MKKEIYLTLLFVVVLFLKGYSQTLNQVIPNWNSFNANQKDSISNVLAKFNAINYFSNELGDDFFHDNLIFVGVYGGGNDRHVLFDLKDNYCNSGLTLIKVHINKWWNADSCQIYGTKEQIISCMNNCDSCKFLISLTKALEIAKAVSYVNLDKHKYRYYFSWAIHATPIWVFETLDNTYRGDTIIVNANTGTYSIGGWSAEE